MKGGCTSCTTVNAFSHEASYFFDIGHSSLVVFSDGGAAAVGVQG
jgi:hypothetical protein